MNEHFQGPYNTYFFQYIEIFLPLSYPLNNGCVGSSCCQLLLSNSFIQILTYFLFNTNTKCFFIYFRDRVYVRGHALDYDRWAGEGAAGWSYSECLPYFKKSQTHELVIFHYCRQSHRHFTSSFFTNNLSAKKNTNMNRKQRKGLQNMKKLLIKWR